MGWGQLPPDETWAFGGQYSGITFHLDIRDDQYLLYHSEGGCGGARSGVGSPSLWNPVHWLRQGQRRGVESSGSKGLLLARYSPRWGRRMWIL